MPVPFEIAVRGTEQVIELVDGVRLTAGRMSQCEIHLDDRSVSRRHCTIEVRGTELVVTDLQSAHGTFINEHLIEQGTARAGDVIRLGASFLEVCGENAPAGRPARSGVFETVMGDDPGNIESVIRKRFEPSQFDWLTSASAMATLDVTLFQRAQRHLTTLHRVSELLANARDIKGLSDATLRAILEVTGADRAALVLRRADSDTGDAEVVGARTRVPSEAQFTVSRALVADVIDKGVSTFAYDAAADERFTDGDSIVSQRVRSVMCVPLRTTDQVLGALYVDSLSGAGRFNEADLELLSAVGNQAGLRCTGSG